MNNNYIKIPYEIRKHDLSPLAYLARHDENMMLDGVVIRPSPTGPYVAKYGEHFLDESSLQFLVNLGLIAFKKEFLHKHAIEKLEEYDGRNDKFKSEDCLSAIKELISISR